MARADIDLASRGLDVHRSSLNLPPLPQEPPSWIQDAACYAQPGAWDDDQPHHAIQQARAGCANCPVRRVCLEANITEPAGVIAGLLPTERAALLGVTPGESHRAPHNTRSRYIGSSRWEGCRCDACKTAHAIYEMDARDRRRQAQLGVTAYDASRPADRAAVRERAWNTTEPSRARIEMTAPPLAQIRMLAKRRQAALSTDLWQNSGYVITADNPNRVDDTAIRLASDLEAEGITGWRLYDTTGELVISTENGPRAPYTVGDTSPGWWTRAGLPWPGQPWTHEHADLLLATSAPVNSSQLAAA